jgi:hypothetical protein
VALKRSALESSVAGEWSLHASAMLGDGAGREARVGDDIDLVEWKVSIDVTNSKF